MVTRVTPTPGCTRGPRHTPTPHHTRYGCRCLGRKSTTDGGSGRTPPSPTQQHDTVCYTPCDTLYSVLRLCCCFLC